MDLRSGWLAKPGLTTLYSGLSARERRNGIAAGRLGGGQSVAHELSPDGAVHSRFPPDQSRQARGWKPPRRASRAMRGLGFELFDTPNWAGTDFTDKVNYQRALEGELERTTRDPRAKSSPRGYIW